MGFLGLPKRRPGSHGEVSGKIRAMSAEALVILCTCPDPLVAESLARGLVARRLAACVNILPGVRSIYIWQENLQDDAEVLLVVKTTAERYESLATWLQERHPYDVPEIIALPAHKVAPSYLDWLQASVAEVA